MNIKSKPLQISSFFALSLTFALSCSPTVTNKALENSITQNSLNIFETSDWKNPPEELKNPLGEGVCTMGFEATVRNGPSKGTQLTGLLKFKTLTDGRLDNAKLYPSKGEPVRVDGQIINGNAELNFYLPGGGVVAGSGEFKDRTNLCSGTLKGPLKGPQVGDTGDWLGDADGTAPIPGMPNKIAYSVTATNQVFIFDSLTNTSTQIAGLTESSTDTLLNAPTGVVYVERLLNNMATTASLDNTDGLWISDTGNQRVIQYKLNTTNQIWEKTNLEVNLSKLQSLYPQATQFRPRGLAEYNFSNIINHRYLLIADEVNHHVFAFTGEGASFSVRPPRAKAFLGHFNYSLNDVANAITNRTSLPANTNILSLFRSDSSMDPSFSSFPIFGDIGVPFYSNKGFVKNPVSLLPKRVIQRVNTLSITSTDNCIQNLINIPGVKGISILNQSTAVFPFPTRLLRETDYFILSGIPANQSSNCYSVENALRLANNPNSSSPAPSPSTSSTPAPSPSTSSTPAPSPSTSSTPAPSLTVTPSEVVMSPGEVVTLTANAVDIKGNVSKNINWSNSDLKLLGMSAKGAIATIEAGKTEGQAEIVAEFPDGNLRKVILVTVRIRKTE